jgi:hypothetical protein
MVYAGELFCKTTIASLPAIDGTDDAPLEICGTLLTFAHLLLWAKYGTNSRRVFTCSFGPSLEQTLVEAIIITIDGLCRTIFGVRSTTPSTIVWILAALKFSFPICVTGSIPGINATSKIFTASGFGCSTMDVAILWSPHLHLLMHRLRLESMMFVNGLLQQRQRILFFVCMNDCHRGNK